MKNAIFIYNPKSGNRSVPNKLDYILGRFQENDTMIHPYRLHKPGDKELEEVLKQNNYDFVVVSGGDGTLNSIVNILRKHDIDVPVGVIPGGTCNDFARSLNIPNSMSDCIDIIVGGNIKRVDIGLINEKQYFLSTCAGGVFVDVSFSTHSELKKNFGPFAYYLKALSEVKNIRPFRLKVTTDSEVIEEETLIFLILNGKDAAGFSNIIEEANISDGIMDIVLIKNCSHIDLASMFFNVLSKDALNNKNVTKLSTKTCTIESESDITLSVDGDRGDNLPVSVRFIKKALQVFVR
ncbi:MAG: YegS/Rv2252/BmrU family lipid kinase [Clostridia bacterium]|nr:YegS/Rv2252/BmrU family lipid kinase [Clostridia bacterium]